MNAFRSPLLVALLGIVSGLGAGLGWFWLKARPLVTEARAAHAAIVAAREAALRAAARPEKPWDFWTIGIENLSAELKDAKALLARREEEINLREARLEARAAEIEKMRAQLEALRREIDTRFAEMGAEEAKNLRTLAQTYSNLTPKAAVAIMGKLDDETTARLLSLMKPDITGAIFEEMARTSAADSEQAKRAAALSERLRVLRAVKKETSP
ncbi:hypothetical protein OpiT1DRAFT_04911 [Opitutaceae bacterium TAV1]|nr:hypothetical protein OpiT1DRAFT_04911 [Opitutaceae bacterium TAV1]